MTPQLILEKTVQFFKQKNISTARLDTEILLTKALNYKNRVDLYLNFNKPLSDEEVALCRALVVRRGSGEPVAYIVESKEFFRYDFFVNKDVLIPRPETEILVESVFEHYKKNLGFQNIEILDLGCGSGCIGLSLAKSIPNAKVTLVDISSEALAVAKINAQKLGVENQVELLQHRAEDLDLKAQRFDYILANPPYIAVDDQNVEESVKKFEPNQALFAEKNGLQFIEAWSENAKPWLKEKSVMAFEMGLGQGEEVQKHFEKLGVFKKVQLIKDLSGIDRHIWGER